MKILRVLSPRQEHAVMVKSYQELEAQIHKRLHEKALSFGIDLDQPGHLVSCKIDKREVFGKLWGGLND